jgi:sodium-dependent dicarboxylate transporter 2/3/5
MPGDESRSRGRGLDARVTLLLGPAVAVALWVAPSLAGMTRDAQNVAGLACWMAVWWIRGTIPLPATSLLPLAALPLLGAGAIRDVAARYADPVIFLFMGGFFLAAATERWDLHRRLALAVIATVGGSAPRVVLAFMAATALVSMWISNTATAAMMLPIGAAVVTMARGSGADPEQTGQFGSALMLGLAYAASIGGAATLIGTPPNAIFAGAASQLLGRPVGFAAWMGVGLPIAVFMLLACWVLLTRVMHRVAGPLVGIEAVIARERNGLGSWTTGAKVTATVFALTALAWLFREPKTIGAAHIPGLSDVLPGLSDAGIAIAAALTLFAFPLAANERRFVLDWDSAARIPWGVLLLFGGGLALAGAIDQSGLARWIGERLSVLAGAPRPVVILAVALLFIFLTELTSNTATAAMGMPVMAALAPVLGVDALVLMGAAALASSLAFMLPVATPPNAMVFGTGAVSARDMMRAGVWLNLMGVLAITGVLSVLAP